MSIPDTFAQLRGAVSPAATVLVLDYPQLFPKDGLPARCQPDAALFAPGVQRFLRSATDLLDETMRRAAIAEGLQFVDVRRTFDGHEVCGHDGGWITHIVVQRPRAGNGSIADISVHPNEDGQAAYARAIRNYIDARIAAGAVLTPAGLPADPPLPGPIAAGDPIP
ncbi:MAG: hypothetical protein JO304_16470 [Solirubrobacterales bacterium]|nr:hypothetical protein [Solirubrobacterales bacterium]